ncbi:hypothetical protein GXW78_20155 [Roseomonas terrae]|jgi:hypothetical protein|uniref:Uncharacterized protein n=1 Tax=Neoroseomonas terrae TaxID=424799 RepID=A0ABS5ELS8_9PROT|nr:hypothetical protein [Neoroseomonas terrae]MBR0651989.1 hypothetical protein [Neoroseomonas terrae]
MAQEPKPKSDTRKINTPLDEQLDDSFPASDPPSLTDPSKKIMPKFPSPADEEDPTTKPGQKGPQS